MNFTKTYKFDEDIFREQAEKEFDISLSGNKGDQYNYKIFIILLLAGGILLIILNSDGAGIIAGPLMTLVGFIYLSIYMNYISKIKKARTEYTSKILTVLLFSSPLFSSGQTEIYPLPTSPEIIRNKYIDLHDSGHLDSVKTTIIHFKDPFNKIEDIKEFYVYADTVKYDDSSYAVGQIILDPSMEFERRKIGEWTFYYPSGKIYSKGSFSIGAYTECQFIGPGLIGYSFKTGRWNYWHENGVVMAEGIYEPTSVEVETNCGQDAIKVSGVTLKWHLFDSSGNKLNDAGDIISRINNRH